MAKIGVRKSRIKKEVVNGPSVIDLLIKHINNEQSDEMLLDLSYEFYGASPDYSCFKIGYDNEIAVIEVIENEDDGYRSFFEGIRKVDVPNLRFAPKPLAIVNIKNVNNGTFYGWNVISVNTNHVWVSFGTDNFDDYYPSFQFDYNPKDKELLDLDSLESYINYVREILESKKLVVETALTDLNSRYSKVNIENIAKYLRENDFEDLAGKVEEIIEIVENE